MALLVLSVAINYIDRGSLSVAAPAMSAELTLNPTQMGLLFSSFFWTYAPLQIVAGWLIDRYSVKVALAVGFLVWSGATFGIGLVSGVQAILILRLLLGVGESVAFPAYSKVIANSFPPQQRGLPNALIDAGVKVGPGLGMLLGGLIVASYGWRWLFIVLGLGGSLWLLPWFIWAPVAESRQQAQAQAADAPTVAAVLHKRDAWGTFIGNFCNNYSYYFLLTWLPSYLVMERHVSIQWMAFLSALPFTASAAASLFGGWASDRWITRGASVTKVRKSFVVAGLLGGTLVLPAALVPSLTVSMVLLTLGYVASGLFSSNHWAITQTLAGPKAAGKWTGLQNGFANLAGVVAPYVTGVIVADGGSFQLAFILAAICLVAGAFSYLFIVGRVEEIHW